MITTDIDFPSVLPCFLRADYAISYTNDITRTQMASGRARQRRVFENVPGQVPVSLLLSETEALIFEGWYVHQLDAINWFNAPIRTPSGIKTYVCRFTQRYSGPALVANKWRYDMVLEMYEQDVLKDGWVEFAPEYVINADILDIALNREWPES